MSKSLKIRIRNKIVGSDYSGQELRLAAYISQDKKLLDAYENDQDAYAIIASQIFNCKYEDCLEFYPEGTKLNIDGKEVVAGYKTNLNTDGKARRSVGKTMVLAGNYGMGGAGAGSLMGKTAQEGTDLLNKYFKLFPGLKAAIDESKKILYKYGYVEDILGRRRHLPDIYLKPYEVYYSDEVKNLNFNPILGCDTRQHQDLVIKKYMDKTKTIKTNKEYKAAAAEALKNDSIIIQANTGKIAQAERQCFNARIQGSAGTLTKKAMIDIFNDPLFKKWGVHLIVTVHDEVLVECPAFYADLVEQRLPELMIKAAQSLGIMSPKMKCDPYCVDRWYADTAAANIRTEYKKFELGDEKKGLAPMTASEAIQTVIKNHTEIPESAIKDVIQNGGDLAF